VVHPPRMRIVPRALVGRGRSGSFRGLGGRRQYQIRACITNRDSGPGHTLLRYDDDMAAEPNHSPTNAAKNAARRAGDVTLCAKGEVVTLEVSWRS
jgi:hypothetical protein